MSAAAEPVVARWVHQVRHLSYTSGVALTELNLSAAAEAVVVRVVQEVRQELVKTARRPAKDADAAKAREAEVALEASNGKKFCRVEFPDSFIQKDKHF